MRYAVDIRHLAAPFPSGVGQYTIQLIRHLAPLMPDDEFLLCVSGSDAARAHVPAFHAPNIRLVSSALPNRVVSAYMKAPFGPALEDIFSVNADQWLFPNLNLIRTRLPYALTVHDVSFAFMPEYFSLKIRAWHHFVQPKRLIEHAQTVLAVSERTKQDLLSLYNVHPKNVHVTHLGAGRDFSPVKDAADARRRNVHQLTFPYFLTLSTIEPRKNIASVVRAYHRWRLEHPSMHPVPHLVIAGAQGWKTEHVFKEIRASRYQKDIHTISYVPASHRAALYRGACALVFPSFYEGFGLPALEAMATGTPVIASFTGAIPEVTGSAALYVDPYNVSDLVQAFHQITISTDLQNRLSSAGVLRAKTFTWEHTANQTCSALQTHR